MMTRPTITASTAEARMGYERTGFQPRMNHWMPTTTGTRPMTTLTSRSKRIGLTVIHRPSRKNSAPPARRISPSGVRSLYRNQLTTPSADTAIRPMPITRNRISLNRFCAMMMNTPSTPSAIQYVSLLLECFRSNFIVIASLTKSFLFRSHANRSTWALSSQ